MTTSTSEKTAPTTAARSRTATRVYGSLVGLAALAVLLQGLWAGIFLEHDGRRDAASGWIDVHARGGDIAILFAALATAWAFWKLRSRVDLCLGTLAFTLLLMLEAYLGGLIRDDGADALTAVHVPLSLLLMGLAVWLPLRARARRDSVPSGS